jgi:hypothetical protein
MGLWSLLAGDIVLGTTLALFFFLVLGFVSAFALLKYLTRSPLWGIVGAFLFVCSPNLNVCRSTTGALAEYCGVCLLPLTYLALTRVMARPSFKRFVLAALAVSWLWLTHLLTAFLGLFFLGALLGIQFVYAAARARKRKATLLKFGRRIALFVGINCLAGAICAYYLIPILTDETILAKRAAYAIYLALSGHCGAILSLFSLTDFDFLIHINIGFARFQLGALFWGGAVAFVYLLARRKNSYWAAPMSALAALIILVIPNPELIEGIKYLNTVQFTFRFLSYFQFLALLMTVFALQTLCRRWSFAKIQKVLLAFGVIFAALFLVKPYLYSPKFPEGFPMIMNQRDILLTPFNIYSRYFYHLTNPNPDEFALGMAGEFLVTPAPGSDSQDKLFEVDLSELARSPAFKGDLIFYALYYPDYQDVTVKLDGRPFAPPIDTYWTQDNELIEYGGLKYSGAHYLRLRSLPREGFLTVETRFRGSLPGNLLSELALASVGVTALGRLWRRRRRRAGPAARAGSAGSAASAASPESPGGAPAAGA